MSSERLFSLPRRSQRLAPPLTVRGPSPDSSRRPPARVERGPAALDLREPSLAVWPGEMVALAGPQRSELLTLLEATRAHHDPRIATVLVDPRRRATACAYVLAARVGLARGLLAVLTLVPDALGRRTLAAFRCAAVTRAPCRCVWLLDGRVYPE